MREEALKFGKRSHAVRAEGPTGNSVGQRPTSRDTFIFKPCKGDINTEIKKAKLGNANIRYLIVLLGLLSMAIIFMVNVRSSRFDFPMIGPGMQDFHAELCGDYLIWRSSANHIIISRRNCVESIPTKVVEVGHDSRFIIAKRNELERRSPNNPDDTYMQPTPDIFDYWILDTSIPKVYGPLTQEEFAQKRQELDIPDNVELKDVYEYRKK